MKVVLIDFKITFYFVKICTTIFSCLDDHLIEAGNVTLAFIATSIAIVHKLQYACYPWYMDHNTQHVFSKTKRIPKHNPNLLKKKKKVNLKLYQ